MLHSHGSSSRFDMEGGMSGRSERRGNGIERGVMSNHREKTPDRVWYREDSNSMEGSPKRNQVCVLYKLKTFESRETYAEKIYFQAQDQPAQRVVAGPSHISQPSTSGTQQGHSMSEYRGNLRLLHTFRKTSKTTVPTKGVKCSKKGGDPGQQKPSTSSDTGGIRFKRSWWHSTQHENKDKKGEHSKSQENKSQEKRSRLPPASNKNMISPLEGLYPAENDRRMGRGYGVQRYRFFGFDEIPRPTGNEEATGNETSNETANANKKGRNMSSIIKEDWDCPEESSNGSMNDKETEREVEKESDFLRKPTRLDELYKNLTFEPENRLESREQTTSKNNNSRSTISNSKGKSLCPKKSKKGSKNKNIVRRKVRERMVTPDREQPTTSRAKEGNRTDRTVRSYETGESSSGPKKKIEIQKIYKVEKVWDNETEEEELNRIRNYTNLKAELERIRKYLNPATYATLLGNLNTMSQLDEVKDLLEESQSNNTGFMNYLESDWISKRWVSLLLNKLRNQNTNLPLRRNTPSSTPLTANSEQVDRDDQDEGTRHSNASEEGIEEMKDDPPNLSYTDDIMEDISIDDSFREELENDIKMDENSNSIISEEMDLKICESPVGTENLNDNSEYPDEGENMIDDSEYQGEAENMIDDSEYQGEAENEDDNNLSNVIINVISNADQDWNSSEALSNPQDNHEEMIEPTRENETDLAGNEGEERLNATKEKKSETRKKFKRKARRNKGGKQKRVAVGGKSTVPRTYPTRNRTRQEKILSNSINYCGNSDDDDEGESDFAAGPSKRRKVKHKTEVDRLREGLHIMFTSIRRRAKRAQKSRPLFRQGEGDDLNGRRGERRKGKKKFCSSKNGQNDGQGSHCENDQGEGGDQDLKKSKDDTQNSDDSGDSTGSEKDSDINRESSESESESEDQNSDFEDKGGHNSRYNLRKPKSDGPAFYVGQRRRRKSRYNLRRSKSRTRSSDFEQRNAGTESSNGTESGNDSYIDERSSESEEESEKQESGINERSAEAEPEIDNQESNASPNLETEQQSASNEPEESQADRDTTELPVSNDTNPDEEINSTGLDNSTGRPVVVLEKLDLNNLASNQVTPAKEGSSTKTNAQNRVRRLIKRPAKTCTRAKVYLTRNVSKFKRFEYRMIKGRYIRKKLTEATEHLPLKKINKKRKKRKKKNDKDTREKPPRNRVKKPPVKNTGTAFRQSIEWLKSYGVLNYAFVKSQVEYPCKLCPVTTEDITAHYKTAHRGSEVMISRLNRREASEAVADAIALGIAEEVENDSGHASHYPCVYNCRMCRVESMTGFRRFFMHTTTHTGEYTWACLVVGCHVTTPTSELMETHIRNEHPNYDFNISAGRVEPFTNVTESGPLYGFICSGCNFVQIFRKNVEDHIKRRHNTSKNISIIKINMSANETSQPTNNSEHFGTTSGETETLQEEDDYDDCIIIQNDDTAGCTSDQRAGNNKTSSLMSAQGDSPKIVELDLDEEPEVQCRMETDFDIKVEREIGPFMRRKWVVGSLQAQILDDAGILYDCLIKTCMFTTRVYSNFESHVRLMHSKTKWRGDCDSCDHEAGADDNLTLVNALEHLIPHTRQTGNQGVTNENSLPRTSDELDSNEEEPVEEESENNIEKNNQTAESDPALLVQEGSGNEDLTENQTSNQNNLSAGEAQEAGVSTSGAEKEKEGQMSVCVREETEEEGGVSIYLREEKDKEGRVTVCVREGEDKFYYLVEQSGIGDGSVFKIQQIQDSSPVAVTTQGGAKKILPMLCARARKLESGKSGKESTKEVDTNSELSLSIPTSVISLPTEDSQAGQSSENTEGESSASGSGQVAEVLKPLLTTRKPSLSLLNSILSINNALKHDNAPDNTLVLSYKPRRKKKKPKSEAAGRHSREYGNTTPSTSNSDIFILKNHKAACFFAHKCGPTLCLHCVRGYCDERCFVIRQPPHGVKQYFCNLCTFRTAVKASMNKHMNSKHKSMRIKNSPEPRALPNTDHSYSVPNSAEANQHPPPPYQAHTSTSQDRSVLSQILPNTNQEHPVFHQVHSNTTQDHSASHLSLPSTTQDRSVFRQVLPLSDQDYEVPQQISSRIIQDFPLAHHIPPSTSEDLSVHHQTLSSTNQELPVHVQILPSTITDPSVFHQVVPHTSQDFSTPHQISTNIIEEYPVAHHIPANTSQDLYHQIIPSTSQDHSVSPLNISNTIQDPSVLHQIALSSHQDFPAHHQIPSNTIEDPSVLDQIPLDNNQDFPAHHQILSNINQDCSVYHQVIPNTSQEFSVFHQIPPNTVEGYSVPPQTPLDTVEDLSLPPQTPLDRVEGYSVPPQTPLDTVEDLSLPTQTPLDRVEGYSVPPQTPLDTVEDLSLPPQTPLDGVEGYSVPPQTPLDTVEDLSLPPQTPLDRVEGYSVPPQTPPNTVEDLSLSHQIPLTTAEDLSVSHQIPPIIAEDLSISHHIPLTTAEDLSISHQIPPTIAEDLSLSHQIALTTAEDLSLSHQVALTAPEDLSLSHHIPFTIAEDLSLSHQIPSSTVEDFSTSDQIPNTSRERNNYFQNPYESYQNYQFDVVNPNPIRTDQIPLDPGHGSHEPVQHPSTETTSESSKKDKGCSSKMDAKTKCDNAKQAPKDTGEEPGGSPKAYCCPLCKTQFKGKKKVLYERHLSEEARCRQFKFKLTKHKSNDKSSKEHDKGGKGRKL